MTKEEIIEQLDIINENIRRIRADADAAIKEYSVQKPPLREALSKIRKEEKEAERLAKEQAGELPVRGTRCKYSFEWRDDDGEQMISHCSFGAYLNGYCKRHDPARKRRSFADCSVPGCNQYRAWSTGTCLRHENLKDRCVFQNCKQSVTGEAVLCDQHNAWVMKQKTGQQLNDIEIPDPNLYLDISIDDLELSVRSWNCLRKADIRSIRDLIRRSEYDLLHLKDFGKKSLAEIKDMLHGMGLDLGMDFDERGNPILGSGGIEPDTDIDLDIDLEPEDDFDIDEAMRIELEDEDD